MTRSSLSSTIGTYGWIERLGAVVETTAIDRIWTVDGGVRTASAPSRGGQMPASLRRRYGGPLDIQLRADRPTILANFVSTLDGVVALDSVGASGGGEVSGFFEPDRFVMGLLRSLADAVMVGSGTVRAAPGHRWTAGHAHKPSAGEFAGWRRALGLATQPTTVVVSASGRIDPTHPGLADPTIPVIVATTPTGAKVARSAGFLSHVEIAALGTSRLVEPQDLAALLVAKGYRVVLCEGGPHLLGVILRAGLLDELFLTLAPHIVGRDDGPSRLALLEGVAFPSGDAPWATLRSVSRAADHLFLRYRLQPGRAGPG